MDIAGRMLRRETATKNRATSQSVATCRNKACMITGTNKRVKDQQNQKKQPLVSTFRNMDTTTSVDNMAEAGMDYSKHVRSIRRIVVSDVNLLRQLSVSGRRTLEEVEEGLFQVHRTHGHVTTRTHELMYRLQDMLLVEECNRLRKQMSKISSLPPDKKSDKIKEREQQLICRIVRIVNKRDAILADLHIEQMRGTDEQEQIDKEYQKWKREWTRMFHTPVIKEPNKPSVFKSVGKRLLNNKQRKNGKS
ncbi:uncharacterized protein LOC135391836 [Ornithodoros turicata]|uniref:uncharacterized protein LOC135391836 n=1 Tax=Ornithodoros turicata TaxID=34597 RepID=UPI0031391B2D